MVDYRQFILLLCVCLAEACSFVSKSDRRPGLPGLLRSSGGQAYDAQLISDENSVDYKKIARQERHASFGQIKTPPRSKSVDPKRRGYGSDTYGSLKRLSGSAPVAVNLETLAEVCTFYAS
jgi:hypothetical protein